MKEDEFDEAEFEAFLQGKGEFARHLRELPQAQPSPELDAAILAIVEKDLACGNAQSAANDAYSPGAKSAFARWKVPLATAATVAFVALLVRQQRVEQPEVYAVASAPAPAAAPVQERLTSAEPPAVPEQKAKQASAGAASRGASGLVLDESAVADRAPTFKQESGPAQKAEPAPQTPAQVAGDEHATNASPAASLPSPEVAKRAHGGNADAAPAPVSLSVFGLLQPVEEGPQADGSAKTASAPVAAAAPARDSFIGLSNPREFDDGRKSRQEVWLANIENLLKQPNTEAQAAREWARFRKEFPDYPVPEALEKRLKALPQSQEPARR